jgi:hypothetical protein
MLKRFDLMTYGTGRYGKFLRSPLDAHVLGRDQEHAQRVQGD